MSVKAWDDLKGSKGVFKSFLLLDHSQAAGLQWVSKLSYDAVGEPKYRTIALYPVSLEMRL